MKSLAIFNNKGGVGKTTLTFHFAHALAEMGHKTLIIDLDPQCNITVFALRQETVEEIWKKEEAFIEDFAEARISLGEAEFVKLNAETRSTHYILKPTEDGIDEIESLPRPKRLRDNLFLIPGRLSLHRFEDKLSSRWSDVFVGDPLALRTVTRIRRVAESYAEAEGFDYVIFDTSPSLGMLNRVALSMADGFIIPCNPDLFSLYGIRNIGSSLNLWRENFRVLGSVLSKSKLAGFPSQPVQFLGYSIYNARRYAGQNEWNLAAGHYNYAKQIPSTIKEFIGKDLWKNISESDIMTPIGADSIMHTHSTMVPMAQKYNAPIWKLPSIILGDDKPTVSGNRQRYEGTREKYLNFANEVLERLEANNV